MCLLVLILSASGSSATNSADTADAVRVPPTPTEPSIVHSQKRELPWATQADIRERQMLAWIILLMKDGRSAR
jgi:hypothetical protein